MRRLLAAGALAVFLSVFVFGHSAITVRVGAFPNITHPQAMVGKASAALERAMGPTSRRCF